MTSRDGAAFLSAVGLAVLLGGCSIQYRPKLQFAGPLLSTDSICPAAQGTLVLQNGEAVFSPTDSTWTLRGPFDKGKLELTHSRPSFDHKTYLTSLTATLSDDRVIGTYRTQSCVYAVNLARF